MTSNTFLAALAASLLTLALPTPSRACTWLPCQQSELFPSTTELPIPASAPFVRLHAPDLDPGSERFTASRTRDGITLPIEVTVVDGSIHLEGAIEGDLWSVRGSHACIGGSTTELVAEVRIGPPVPLPTSLGTLDVGATRQGPVEVVEGGACHGPIDAASATVGVVLDPTLEPFADLIVWQTEVDGRPYDYRRSLPDRSRETRDVLLVAACEEPGSAQFPPDLEPGTHLVERLAWLPGSDVPLRASAEVTLECTAIEPTSSSGCAAGGTGAGAWLLAIVALRRRRR